MLGNGQTSEAVAQQKVTFNVATDAAQQQIGGFDNQVEAKDAGETGMPPVVGNGEIVGLSDIQIQDSLHLHQVHGVPLVPGKQLDIMPKLPSESDLNGQNKVLVKRDSGHTGVPNPQVHMEKRIKKLKKINQRSCRDLSEPRFTPLNRPLTNGDPETRRIKFADQTGGDLYQTTFTEKLHYPIEVTERDENPAKPATSCCVIC